VVQSTIRTPLSGPDTARSGLGAAGDHEGLAAHEVAVRAAEEVDRPRGLLGQPPAAERDHLVHGRDARALHADLHLAPGHLDGARLALRERLGEPGLDVAEGHAVHGHRVAAPLLGQRASHAGHRGLGRGVVDLARVATHPGGRGDLHDLPDDSLAPLRLGLELGAQVGGEGAQDAEGRGHVNVHDRVPLLVGHLLDDVVPRVARVVHDHVEPAEALDRGAHDALAEVLGGHVAVAGHRAAARLLDERDGLLGGRVVEVVHHHRGPVPCQPQRHLLADTSPGAGHDRHLAVELSHGFRLLAMIAADHTRSGLALAHRLR
jgi:hypothetical protein